MSEQPEKLSWRLLTPVALGVFVVVMDVTVINVALPSIREDLGYLDVNVSDLQWIVNAYALTFGVLMLAGGKLADIFGRRLVFMVGLVIFAISSLGAGLAEDVQVVIICRALQGVGGALVLPASLSIITVGFPAAQRAIAVAIWSALVGLGVAIGPLLGGILSELINWRWVFLIAIPFSVLSFVFAALWIKESRAPAEHRSFDAPGVVASSAALFCLVFGLQKANEWEWGDARTIGLLAGSVVLTVLFIAWERRTKNPLVDLALFRSPTFAGANVVSLLSGFVLIGGIFYMNLFTQTVMAYEPIKAGAVLLPMTALSVLAAPLAGRLTDAHGARWVLAAGMLMLGGGLISLVGVDLDTGFWSLLPMLVVGGVGFAFVLTPVTAAALAGVPARQAGIGSAVVNSARQVGGALGLAVLGAVNVAITDDALEAGRTRLEGFVDSFAPVMIVGAVTALLGAVVAAAFVVGKIRASAAPAEAAEPVPQASGAQRISWTLPTPDAGQSLTASTRQHALLTTLREGPAVARLEVRVGPLAGSTIGVPEGGLVFGRAEAGIGNLGGDGQLSRRHARIHLSDGRLLLEDLGSTNGTHVAGRAISEATPVAVGDVITLAGSELRVADLAEPQLGATAGRDQVTRAAPTVRLELEVVEGPAANSRLRLAGEPLVLGRAEPGDGSLGCDAQLSRRHASAMLLGPGGILLEDLGSTNGTLVNGSRIAGPTVLKLGDSVQVGATTLRAVEAVSATSEGELQRA